MDRSALPRRAEWRCPRLIDGGSTGRRRLFGRRRVSRPFRNGDDRPVEDRAVEDRAVVLGHDRDRDDRPIEDRAVVVFGIEKIGPSRIGSSSISRSSISIGGTGGCGSVSPPSARAELPSRVNRPPAPSKAPRAVATPKRRSDEWVERCWYMGVLLGFVVLSGRCVRTETTVRPEDPAAHRTMPYPPSYSPKSPKWSPHDRSG